MTAFLILDVIFVVFQVMGQYLASGAQSADVTGDEPMFALGVGPFSFRSRSTPLSPSSRQCYR